MRRVSFSLALTLLAAFVYYYVSFGLAAAFVCAAAAHELGHLLVLRFFGAKIRSLSFDLCGANIEYYGNLRAFEHITAALAGPLAGLVYALAASAFASRSGLAAPELSAGISLLLSGFNLLPAMPLDGGNAARRIFCAVLGDERGTGCAEALGLSVSILVFAAGACAAIRQKGFALLALGFWLIIYQSDTRGLVKNHRLL